MQIWPFDIPGLIVFICGVVGACVLFFKLNSNVKPKDDSAENKALLRELLEGFDLEIPSELQDQKEGIVRSIETQ